MIPIVDTHQHLWNLTQFHLPWLDGGGPLAKSHTPEDYARETEGLNVVKTVYMEVDVEASQRVAEAEYVLGLCADPDNPMAGAVIGGNPLDEGFVDYIERFAENPYLKGVRQVLHGGMPSGTCLQPEFRRNLNFLAQAGLRFDLCLRPEDLRDGAKLAYDCIYTKIVLDHCGNADPKSGDLSQWKRNIEEYQKCWNVNCKISGIIAGARPNAWTRTILLRLFGTAQKSSATIASCSAVTGLSAR